MTRYDFKDFVRGEASYLEARTQYIHAVRAGERQRVEDVRVHDRHLAAIMERKGACIDAMDAAMEEMRVYLKSRGL